MSNRRPNQSCSEDRREFTVLIYESEYRQIQAWVDKYKHLETGGDLFGLWSDERTAVVQLVLGPGKGCKRTSVSFYQDMEYLERVVNQLTSNSLCHIGEWHSHHTLGLTRPSGGDENTIWSNMDRYDIERFFLFIATIESKIHDHDVKVRCFLFERDSNTKRPKRVLQGLFKPMNQENPFRKMNTELLQNGEESQNSTELLKEYKSLQEESTDNGKINQGDNDNKAKQKRKNLKGKDFLVNKQNSRDEKAYTKRVNADVKLSVEKDKSDNDEDKSGPNSNQHNTISGVIHVGSKDRSDVSTNATQPDKTNPSTSGKTVEELGNSESTLQEENMESSINKETLTLNNEDDAHGQGHKQEDIGSKKKNCCVPLNISVRSIKKPKGKSKRGRKKNK